MAIDMFSTVRQLDYPVEALSDPAQDSLIHSEPTFPCVSCKTSRSLLWCRVETVTCSEGERAINESDDETIRNREVVVNDARPLMNEGGSGGRTPSLYLSQRR